MKKSKNIVEFDLFSYFYSASTMVLIVVKMLNQINLFGIAF